MLLLGELSSGNLTRTLLLGNIRTVWGIMPQRRLVMLCVKPCRECDHTTSSATFKLLQSQHFHFHHTHHRPSLCLSPGPWRVQTISWALIGVPCKGAWKKHVIYVPTYNSHLHAQLSCDYCRICASSTLLWCPEGGEPLSVPCTPGPSPVPGSYFPLLSINECFWYTLTILFKYNGFTVYLPQRCCC